MSDCTCGHPADDGCGCGPEVEIGCACGVEVDIPAGSVPSPKPQGERVKAVVTSAGPVCRGEFVHRELEYIPQGDALRWVLEDVRILDAAELSQGRVGVVFTQGGKTKFKVIALADGALALGNTLVLLEDEALEAAALVELGTDRGLVLYARDGDGMGSVITLADRVAKLAYTDIWLDGGDPTNLTACVLPEAGWCIISVVLGATTPRDGGHPGECWVWGLKADDKAKSLTQYYLLGQRLDIDHDADVYAGAWSMAAVEPRAAVLCYPRALDKPVGFAVLDTDHLASNGSKLTLRVAGEGSFAASLPCIQAASLGQGRWIMAYAVAWLTQDRTVNKSALAIEAWGLTRYAAERLWYGYDEARYNAGMGGVSVRATPNGAAITYTVEADAKAVYVSTEYGPAPGAAVPLPANSGWCRVVPISVTKAILVYADGGNAYAQYMELAERVEPVTSRVDAELAGYIDGYALSGGGPGDTITVQIPK